MHAISDNGKPLWRSAVIERQRLLTELPLLIDEQELYLQASLQKDQVSKERMDTACSFITELDD